MENTPLTHNANDSSGDDPERGHFRTRFGMVVSFIGCMVGAGNIWRFPRIAANNSGDTGALQFLLVWFMFLFLWSIPMLVIEYAVGRYCKCSPIMYFQRLVGPYTVWMGAWIAAVSTAIGCYYSVLCSWCVYYLYFCIAHDLPDNEAESDAVFRSFAEESHWVLIPQFVVVALCGVTILWGVKTIERVNSVIVPTFLVLLVFTFIWSLTLPYASNGIAFLFSPDWGRLATPQLWIDAASQNAFDTGAGWGLMASYAAFMTRDNAIIKCSLAIPLGNNLLSLMSGMTTFATVFSVETSAGLNQTEIVQILQSSGPANTGLTFIWMPILYSTIKGGKVLAIVFFLALSLALFSTEIAILELSLKSIEDLGVKRKYVVAPLCCVVFLIGIGSALRIDYLVNQDLVWSYALLLSGIAFIFSVYRYGSDKFRSELINKYSTSDWYLPKLWEWMVKFVAPLEVSLLLVWFAVDQVVSNNEWYQIDGDNLMSCIVQWTAVLIMIIIFNIIYIRYFSTSLPTPPYDNMMTDLSTEASGSIQMYDGNSSKMASE